MEYKTQIGNNGRIILPVKLRKALDLRGGEQILLRLENDSIRVIPLRQAIRLAQESVAQYLPKDANLVDDLIRSRREEARRE